MNHYGIEMTSLESQNFEKWLSSSNIAMNTKTVEERKKVASGWLVKNKEVYLKQKGEEK